MNGELAVIGILRDDTTVSGIVGAKVRLYQAEESDTLPFVIVEEEDIDPFDTKNGVSAKDHDRIRVYPYAETKAELKTLYAACRAALDGKAAATYNGVNVEWIKFMGQTGFEEKFTNKKAVAKDQEYLVRVIL